MPNITVKEINATIRHLKAAVKKGNRALFDSNAAYLKNMVHALILEQGQGLEPIVLPLYAVKVYSKITETEASFDVRASSEINAVRAIRNAGLKGDKHIIRSIDLVRAS
jgi:hypothetical protein